MGKKDLEERNLREKQWYAERAKEKDLARQRAQERARAKEKEKKAKEEKKRKKKEKEKEKKAKEEEDEQIVKQIKDAFKVEAEVAKTQQTAPRATAALLDTTVVGGAAAKA